MSKGRRTYPLMRAVFARGVAALAVGFLLANCSGSDTVTIDPTGSNSSEADAGVVAPDTCEAEKCPGEDSECAHRVCQAGSCATEAAAYGTKLKEQKAGDCRTNKCDGEGKPVAVVDDSDVPDDQNPCTAEECSVGSVSIRNAAEGTPCGASLSCDGHGVCVGCNTPADCPGSDTECRTRTCTDNKCGVSYVAAGKALATQTPNDCLKNTCDGQGNVAPIIDDSDVPVDGNACTRDVCTAGQPSNPPTASGTSCGANGGTTCDGKGACVQCLTAATCPGVDDECKTRTCTNNKCGVTFAPITKVSATQVTGDCKERRCNGLGGTMNVSLDTDLPVDGKDCTSDVCSGGTPSNPSVASGSPCNDAGGKVCTAAGACVECNTPSDCPGADTVCQTRTCNPNKCGVDNTGAGTPTPTNPAHDCKKSECDGNGAERTVNDDTDFPDDGLTCTLDICGGGTASHPPVPAGTPCAENGGTKCDANGACLP